MGRYIARRLVQAVFTVFGVMLLTFVLFRVIAGDVSTAYVNQKLGAEARHAFYEKHKLDRPGVFNFHKRLELTDHTSGPGLFTVADSGGSRMSRRLDLHRAGAADRPTENARAATLASKLIYALSRSTPLEKVPLGRKALSADSAAGELVFSLNDRTSLSVVVHPSMTMGALLDAINGDPRNGGKVDARISSWSLLSLFDSQFFWHLYESVTFQGHSYATNQKLLSTIAERGKFSLSITVPAMALGFLAALIVSGLVAYYRDTWIDRIGVLLSVLGMCVPYLAYMLLGQWLMFKINPALAAGLSSPSSIYVPVSIAVIAGLGWGVRFYRTIILDEISKDYVRTARARGVPLPTILFKHVLKNCMLPILTDVISSLPFLIMGSLLLERFFGIPGLGDLILTSITSRDVPIISGITYLTAVLYVLSLLATDILYAVVDPRVRLR